jgi:nitrate/nitrite transporter NarK
MMKFTPSEKRNLVFSIQQTGVPFGGILAALIAPPIAVALGWRWSLAASASLLLIATALMQIGRRWWDADRNRSAPVLAPNALETLSIIWRNPHLRLMAFVGSCFSWGQFVVASYTVVSSVATFGMSLIGAGMMLTLVQLGNAAGRVAAGWAADRVGGTIPLLRWISWLMLGGALGGFALAPGWPLLLIYGWFGVLGVATGARAGMVLADVGRHAPAGRVSMAIGGSLAYVNVGKFIGPIVFANIYLATGSYGIAFASLAIPACLALLCLARMARPADVSGLSVAGAPSGATRRPRVP